MKFCQKKKIEFVNKDINLLIKIKKMSAKLLFILSLLFSLVSCENWCGSDDCTLAIVIIILGAIALCSCVIVCIIMACTGGISCCVANRRKNIARDMF